MRERDAWLLRLAAALLATVVALVHLFHPSQGVVALFVYARVGYLGDPRPLAFTLLGLALLGGVLLAALSAPKRPLYAGGAALAALPLVSYVVWHVLLDHGAFWPYLKSRGGEDHHTVGALETVLAHLTSDGLELVAFVSEFALLVALASLLALDR